jgi:hypothetical protein
MNIALVAGKKKILSILFVIAQPVMVDALQGLGQGVENGKLNLHLLLYGDQTLNKDI